MKTRRRKTTKLKTREQGTAARTRGSSAANLKERLEQRTRELSEALEQQTATSEVLRVISSSSGDLEPVFKTMLANAVRICEARFGLLYRIKNGAARIISKLGMPPAFEAYLRRGPHRPPLNRLNPLTPIGRVIQTHRTVHIADYREDQTYLDRDPITVAAIELGGIRTLLVVPMIKNDELMGAIVIFRQEVRPFTDKQIELVQNFAAQAVIAIENARLLSELRQRTDDLSEALEQQTAMSEVLGVISRSPTELEPVFETIVKNAARLCHSVLSAVYRSDGERVHLVAHDQFSAESVAAVQKGLSRLAHEQQSDRDRSARAACRT